MYLQQIFIELLLCTRHYTMYVLMIEKLTKQVKISLPRTCSPVKKTQNKYIKYIKC